MHRLIVCSLTAVTAIGISLGFAGTASASPGGNAASPPGNNGTVKIDGFQMDAGQDNDPHVSCGLTISFFGYDAGQNNATIILTPTAPTGGGSAFRTSTNWNTATRTGGNQLDQSVSISQKQLDDNATFAGVTATRQGYHVRLEVEVSGSQGSDDKFKVFWLQPCGAAAGPEAAPSTASTNSGPAQNGSATASTPIATATPTASNAPTGTSSLSSFAGFKSAGSATPTGSPTSATSGGPTTRTLTRSAAASEAAAAPRAATVPSSPPSSGRGSLAFTGFDTTELLSAGVALLIAGSFLVTQRRRFARSGKPRPGLSGR